MEYKCVVENITVPAGQKMVVVNGKITYEGPNKRKERDDHFKKMDKKFKKTDKWNPKIEEVDENDIPMSAFSLANKKLKKANYGEKLWTDKKYVFAGWIFELVKVDGEIKVSIKSPPGGRIHVDKCYCGFEGGHTNNEMSFTKGKIRVGDTYYVKNGYVLVEPKKVKANFDPIRDITKNFFN